MLWETSAETEIVDGVEHRNVWMKDDPDVRRDALALGRRMTPPSRQFMPDVWAKNLCTIAYQDGNLVALAVIDLRYSKRVRANMGYLRIFIAPECRQRGIAIPLTLRAHEIIRRYSLANPEKRIGGTMALVTVKGMMDEPVGKAFMVLIGYSPKSEPVLVRWFDHYKL